jgi:hypothetical protein
MAVISKTGSGCPRFQQVTVTSLTKTIGTSFKITYYLLLNVIKLIPTIDLYSKLMTPMYFPIFSMEQIIK